MKIMNIKDRLLGFCEVVPFVMLLAGTAAVGGGCSRDTPPSPQLTLPAAPGSSPFISHDPLALEVAVDASGNVWFQNKMVTLAELRERLVKTFKRPVAVRIRSKFGCRTNRYAASLRPVAIRADAKLDFGTVREVIALLESLGLGIVNVIVLQSSPDIESVLMFHVSKPWQSDFVVFKIDKNGVTTHGRSIARDRIQRMLGQLAAVDRTVPIVIVPSANARYADFVQMLEACFICQLYNVYVLDESSDPIEGGRPAPIEPRIIPPAPHPYVIGDE